jgi:hypothetical protein
MTDPIAIRKRRLWFAISAAVIAVLVGLFFFLKWHYTPIRQTVEMTVCSIDGEVETVQFDLTYYRTLFAPTQVCGTVTFKGIEHKDFFAHHGHAPERGFLGEQSFWVDLKEKLSGTIVFPHFSQNLPFSEDGWGASIFLPNYGGNGEAFPEQVMFSWSPSDDAGSPNVIFFGPADSAEEARAINDAFVNADKEN